MTEIQNTAALDLDPLRAHESEIVAIIEGFLHDFKSPIMNLKMARAMGDDEAVDASINTIDSFLANLMTILQDEKYQTDILVAITHALTSCRYILNTFSTSINIQVLNNTEYDQIFVQSRGMSLERILLNLFKNAAEVLTAQTDPTLTITVSESNDRVTIEIHDNGKGIDPDVLPRIFEKGITTKKEGRHGWGLYIVKTMMDRCAGTVTVTSELGKGTSFFLSFPIYNRNVKKNGG